MRADKASRLGVTLQSIIEVWLAERLRQPACNKSFRTPRSTRAAENAADWLAFARWEAQHSRYAFGIECEAGYLIRPRGAGLGNGRAGNGVGRAGGR